MLLIVRLVIVSAAADIPINRADAQQVKAMDDLVAFGADSAVHV